MRTIKIGKAAVGQRFFNADGRHIYVVEEYAHGRYWTKSRTQSWRQVSFGFGSYMRGARLLREREETK